MDAKIRVQANIILTILTILLQMNLLAHPIVEQPVKEAKERARVAMAIAIDGRAIKEEAKEDARMVAVVLALDTAIFLVGRTRGRKIRSKIFVRIS